MNSSKINFKSILSASFLSLLLIAPAFAQENIISSVVISKSKEKPNAYELNIDSTEAVQYKTTIDEDGSIYFDLKNSIVSDDIGTVYDDASNIDNVVVKQLDKNKVRIYVKGRDVKNTELVFVNSLFETNRESSKKIIINRPINEYQPTNHLSDLDSQEEIQDWDDNSFNFSHLLSGLLAGLKEGPMGIVMILLTLFAILAIIIKNLTAKISADSEPLIGLNNAKNYIINPAKNSAAQTVMNDAAVCARAQALKNAQIELTKAHEKYRTYLQNKYKDNYKEKLKSVNIDAIKKGIALNQYRKSTQNPYLDQEVIKIKKDLKTSQASQSDDFRIPPRPKKTQYTAKPANFTSPYIQRPKNKINYTPAAQKKDGSMKFLESVTKIYEQSGRSDLAAGLKNSISKAKQSI